MTEPDEKVTAQKKPYVLELEPGVYYYCACGRSSTQPFCDGSHKVTAFTPVRIELIEKKKISFCGCRRSKEGFRCDGAHKTLP